MADRHRHLVLFELAELLAGVRGDWSGRAVGGLARILTRRTSDRWDGMELDRLAGFEHPGDGRDADGRDIADEGLAELEAWVLDWLRLVSYTPPITTASLAVAATLRARDAFARYDYVGGVIATAEAASAYCDLAQAVRVAGGWVDRATLEHVQRLVSRALEHTESVREARRGVDPLMVKWCATRGRPAPRRNGTATPERTTRADTPVSRGT